MDSLKSLSRSIAASICMYSIISTKKTASFNAKAIYAGGCANSSAIINNERLYYYEDTVATGSTRRYAGAPIAGIARQAGSRTAIERERMCRGTQ